MSELTVLVVDDQREWLDLATSLLSGCPSLRIVGTARTGEEALALVPTLRPSVVVCDVGLPGMNGFQVARRLRGAGSRTVVVSCETHPEYPALARNAGAEGYLPKQALSARALLDLLKAHSPSCS
jgi:DNA-binding NarL/FixJ family response regulator